MARAAAYNYIAAAGICFLAAATLLGCSQGESSVDLASETLALEYPQIPRLNNNDTVIYDDVTPEFVLTYAENQTEDYPTTQAGYRFAQLVNIRSEGRIQIRLYADSELGDEVSTIQQVRMGGIDLVRVSLATVTDYNEESIALMMPYIYRDSSHMWAVLQGDIGDRIMEGFEGSGFTPLSWYDAGVRNLYFTEPVERIEDMEGLRIRVQTSSLMEEMVRRFGAVPVPTEYEDVYSALEQNTVDGAENNWSSYNAMNHNEVAPYYMDDEHMRIPELQIISDITATELGDEYMEIIRKCAQESSGYERYLWRTYEKQAQETAIASGTEIIHLTDEERTEFVDAALPLYDKYCATFPDLMDAIRESY